MVIGGEGDQEHNILPKTVQRSADLSKSHQTTRAAPEVAQKLETQEIKAPKKELKKADLALVQWRIYKYAMLVQIEIHMLELVNIFLMNCLRI